MLVTHGFRPRRSLRDQAAESFQNRGFQLGCSGAGATAAAEPPGGGPLRTCTPTHLELSPCDCAFATERRQVLLKPPSRRVPTQGGAADAVADGKEGWCLGR